MKNLKTLIPEYTSYLDKNGTVSFYKWLTTIKYTNPVIASDSLGYVTTGELRRHCQVIIGALMNEI